MVSVLDVGWERLYKGLETVVHKGGDALSGRVVTGHNGASRVARFMNFGEQVEVGGYEVSGARAASGWCRRVPLEVHWC